MEPALRLNATNYIINDNNKKQWCLAESLSINYNPTRQPTYAYQATLSQKMPEGGGGAILPCTTCIFLTTSIVPV